MHLLNTIEELTKIKRRLVFDSEDNIIATVYDLKGIDGIAPGPVSDEVYNALYKKLVLKGKKKVLELLTDSDRTRRYINNKLKFQGYTDSMIKEIIDYIDKYNYLDDRRFAENYIDYHKDSMNKKQLLEKLRSKGVPDEILEELFSDIKIDCTKQIERILLKRIRNDKNALINKEFRDKQIRYLLSKGYNYADIKKVLISCINS